MLWRLAVDFFWKSDRNLLSVHLDPGLFDSPVMVYMDCCSPLGLTLVVWMNLVIGLFLLDFPISWSICFVFVFERVSLCIPDWSGSLWRQGGSQTQRSACWVPGLKECTTMPNWVITLIAPFFTTGKWSVFGCEVAVVLWPKELGSATCLVYRMRPVILASLRFKWEI